MRVTDTHVYFWGSYLSNFYRAPFKATVEFPLFSDLVEFHSSEQYYMVCKALHFKDYDSVEKILTAPDAKIAKAFGREVKNFDADEWNKNSYPHMVRAVRYKFFEPKNIVIRERIIETGDKILVEASPIDLIWGVGLHEDDDAILDKANWRGENRLGNALMEIRADLNYAESD